MSWKIFYSRLAKMLFSGSSVFGVILNLALILLPFASGIWFWRQSACDNHGYIVIIILVGFVWSVLPMIKKIWELEDSLHSSSDPDS